ncbi:hypothetical protein R3W88_000713 [Solanum pinnatisectum]|uniref:WRKY domain-containing protein n=1 Tax=Solanum pinnatisectum TaxID=50273 RepID=A0AAV9MGG9_9SOLN|nr:hypothetical protein R3W88_000713 [Solanum pinnatisectum]
MSENEASSSSSKAPILPTIQNLFMGMGGPNRVGSGPMNLVSTFSSDPDSQLLAGAMTSPAPFSGTPQTAESGGSRGSGNTQSSLFTIPPGLSLAGLLGSPLLFSPGQGHFGMSHQQALAQVTAQAALPHSQWHIQPDYPSSSTSLAPLFSQFQSLTLNATANPEIPPNVMKETSDLAVDKPADDGYNWRKYGQKVVKGSEYAHCYYKCTHPNCPVKKKVERSLDGQVTEIIYKGQHNHQLPQPNKCSKESGNPNGTYRLQGPFELNPEGVAGTLRNFKDNAPSHSLKMKDQESESSEGEEVGDAETIANRNDEHKSKRRTIKVQTPEAASSRIVKEPTIIVQTTSEVDLLDDSFTWQKYGQKVVKGNPYPRSYYKCTSQGCNVRKHVERSASDPKAVVTTYKGKHNHDVPAARNSSQHTSNNSVSHTTP